MTCAEVENVAQPGARWRKWDWLRWRSEERTIDALDVARREIYFNCEGNLHCLPMADWGRWLAGARLVYSPPRKPAPLGAKRREPFEASYVDAALERLERDLQQENPATLLEIERNTRHIGEMKA